MSIVLILALIGLGLLFLGGIDEETWDHPWKEEEAIKYQLRRAVHEAHVNKMWEEKQKREMLGLPWPY